MMGPKQEAQAALFYEFCWRIMFRKITFCVRLIGSLISVASAPIWRISTATLGRLRLRGPCGANDEFLLAATAQNLRKLAKIFPAPQQTRKA